MEKIRWCRTWIRWLHHPRRLALKQVFNPICLPGLECFSVLLFDAFDTQYSMPNDLLLLWPFKNGIPVVLGLFDALQNVIPGLVLGFFGGDVGENVLAAPASGSFFDGTDVEDAMVQMLHDLRVGLLAQKASVCVDAVAREQGLFPLGDELGNVLIQTVGGSLWRQCRLEDSRRQTRAGVCLCAPLVHLAHPRLWPVDDSVVALFIEQLHAACGEDAVDFNYFLGVWVQTRHLREGVC